MKKRQLIRRGIVIVSMLLLPVTLYWFSPVLILTGAFQGIISGSFIFFAAQFVLALFFGRLWCSWLCPVGGISVTCAMARPKPVKPGKKNLIRFFLWTPWIVAIVFGLLTAANQIRIEPLFQMTNGISAGDIHGFVIYYFILVLIVSMAFIGGQRAFCHTLCWMSYLLIISRKISRLLRLPSVAIRTRPEKCIQCTRCTKSCSMGLEVHSMIKTGEIEHRECISCGNCVDKCSVSAIHYTFARPLKK